MHWEYQTLYSRSPRSFLFAVVANVGPGGTSRPLAVAYRQHHDTYNKQESWSRIHHMITDTLALIEVLSEPANRAMLEAERALAEDWYRRSPHEPPIHERPSVSDTAQPPFVPCCSPGLPVEQQPPLPWRDHAIRHYPFTATCVLLALLRDDRDANASRLGDVQFQPLSTVFRADCAEYGLVILDISDLEGGVKYGIAAFPVRYMADVPVENEFMSWDPVGQQPEKVDVALMSPRPRVLLSSCQWVRKYYRRSGLDDHPRVPRLEQKPLVDAAALDYIWPPELTELTEASSRRIFLRISECIRPSKKARLKKPRSTLPPPYNMIGYTIDEPPRDVPRDYAKDMGNHSAKKASDGDGVSCTPTKDDRFTTRASSVTISDEPPQTVPEDIDRAMNDLLRLTREPMSPAVEQQALAHLQMLAPFGEKLRQRLEEVPDRLGPSTISSHVLRVAYTGHDHLNWVAFGDLPPCVIAAAVASDELSGASALSLCVDAYQLAGDGGEGKPDLDDLAAELAQSTALQQLCFLQGPDRSHDDVSARFSSHLLRLWERSSGGKDWELVRSKTIHSTSAFFTGLRSRAFSKSSSTMGLDSGSTSSGAHVVPIMHLFTFETPQCEGVPDAATDHHVHRPSSGYRSYYSVANTGLDAEAFAARFLIYLRSLGPYSDPDKAILRVAYHGAFSSLASPDEDNKHYRHKRGRSPPWSRSRPAPLRSTPDQLGVRPIPAGLFDAQLAPDQPFRVRLRDFPRGSWVVLVSRRNRNCRLIEDDGGAFLQYSFVRIRRPSAEVAPQQQEHERHRPTPLSDSFKIVGGLTDFLRETVPETDISMWEKRVDEVEGDLVSALAMPRPPPTPPTEETAMEKILRRLNSASKEPVVEVERVGVRVMAESWAHTLLSQLL